MESKTNQNDQHEADSSFGSLGRGLQFMIQTPLFIIVGIIVVIWETVSKLFQTIYSQGLQYGPALGGAKPAAAPMAVKVPILPIDNYSRMDVDEIIKCLDGLSPAELAVVKNFESSHENRGPIVNAIDKRLAEMH
jgi:hypothetical protein